MATLSRWDPFGEMQRLTEQMLRGWGGELEGRTFAPAVDVYEDADAIYLKAELPGVRADDVGIDVENHVLTIRGERRLERDDKREGYRRIESSYGAFARSFALPESALTDRVDADMEDGVLKLRIPKQPEVGAKRIPVKSRERSRQEKQITATASSGATRSGEERAGKEGQQAARTQAQQGEAQKT